MAALTSDEFTVKDGVHTGFVVTGGACSFQPPRLEPLQHTFLWHGVQTKHRM